MKLFDDFEAVRFPEENLILVTNDSYLSYIYNPQDRNWVQYEHAGHDRITVSNYQDVSEEEIKEAMGGIFPHKETDFVRLCSLGTLSAIDITDIIEEDYPTYMADRELSHAATMFLRESRESDCLLKSYQKLKELLDNAVRTQETNEQVLRLIKELSFDVIGRDIYKWEIGIVDGHDYTSYFWIMPKRVVDFSDTDDWDNIAALTNVEISIEESDVDDYLTPFLYKYYDDDLEANKKRQDHYWIDDDGNEHITYKKGFQWYLTDNFYTFDAVRNIIADIRKTIDDLSAGKDSVYSLISFGKRGWVTYDQYVEKCGKNQNDVIQEKTDEINENSSVKEHYGYEMVIDFYRRFIFRMEYMINIGKEKGFDLISFCGP